MDCWKIGFIFVIVSIQCYDGSIVGNTKKSWVEAKKYCFNNGGILQSNETLIRRYFGHSTDIEVWIGKFEVFTPYSAIYGCYKIKGSVTKITPFDGDHLKCQKLCPLKDFEFFSVKGSECYCLTKTNIWQKTDYEKCIDEHAQFLKIYKQQIKTDAYSVSDPRGNGECIAAQCKGDVNMTLWLTSEICSLTYKVICDNIQGYFLYAKQFNGSETCKERSSFIKYYSNETCPGNGQHWTGARRKLERLTLHETDKQMQTKVIVYCVKGSYFNHKWNFISENCSHEYTFLCRNDDDGDGGEGDGNNDVDDYGGNDGEGDDSDSNGEGDGDDGNRDDEGEDLISTTESNYEYNKTMLVEERTSYTGAIVGSLVTVLAMAAVVVAVFIYRRRLSSQPREEGKSLRNPEKKGHAYSQTKGNQQPAHRDNIISNPNYSIANPNQNEASILQNELRVDYSEGFGKSKTAENTYDSPKHFIETHSNYHEIGILKEEKNSVHIVHQSKDTEQEDSTDYCFAIPINEEDNEQYASNIDYDRLRNVKKKENPKHKVYDHLPTFKESDPTYDHTNLTFSTTCDSEYDRFNA